MSDNLEWMNRHAVLLREPEWAGIAAKENYKIRPDLRPIFDAHPDSLELLDAMAAHRPPERRGASRFRDRCCCRDRSPSADASSSRGGLVGVLLSSRSF